MAEETTFQLAGGKVVIWSGPDQPIQIKAADGGAVALSEDEALDVAEALNALVRARLDQGRG